MVRRESGPFAGKRGTAPHTGAVLAEGNGGRAKRAATLDRVFLRRLMRGRNGCGFPARPNAGVLAIVLWLRAFLPEIRRYAAGLCKRLPVPNPRQGPARRCRLAMPFLRKRQGRKPNKKSRPKGWLAVCRKTSGEVSEGPQSLRLSLVSAGFAGGAVAHFACKINSFQLQTAASWPK